MLARYLVLPSFLLELALAATYSNSSEPTTTSTLQITSFLTVTAPPPLGTGNLSANGTGLDYASSCNQAKQEWVFNIGQTFVSNSTFITSTASVSYTVIRSGWIETIGPTEVYTLCDGYPRMNASTEYKTLETTPAVTSFSTFTTTSEVYRNVSAPTCVIAPAECSVLESEYNSSVTAAENYYSQTRSGFTGSATWPSVEYPTSPICGVPTIRVSRTTLAPAACMYNHATIQLLYWPVETVGNHICGNNWTTVEATPTIEGQPNTAVGYNTTFTSPTVYMVMSGAYEVGSNFATGTAINGILPMAPNRVSSMCASQGGAFGPPEPMDYADFDAPVPKSKYLCQPACWTKPDYPQSWQNSAYNITATENLCSTIHDQVYKPALQVPVEEFNSFYSQFTNGVGLEFGNLQCSFSPGTDGIFYDPPSALRQAASADGPTAPGTPGTTTPPSENPQTTPAAPGNTIPTTLPQTTGAGDGPSQPTQPANPPPSGGGDNDDDPADPSSPSDPGNGGDGGGDDDSNPSDPGSPSDPGNNGGGDGGDNGGGNGGDNADPGSPSNPAPTQNVGGIIASVIGANPGATPGSTGQDGTPDASDPSDSSPSGSSLDDSSPNDSTPGSPSDSDNGGSSDSNAAPAQGVILTDSSGQSVTAILSGDNLILPSATIAVGQGTSVVGIGSISADSEGIVQNGQSIGYETVTPAPSSGNGNDVYVVDGQTYTADASSNVVVAPGVTLTAGGSAATVDGTTYSLAPSSDGNDGELVVNGVTATASEGSGTASGGVPQQTVNAASGLGFDCLHLGVAMALAVWGMM